MTKHTDAYMERLRALQLEQAEASGALEASVSMLLEAYNESADSPTDIDWRFLQESYDRVDRLRLVMRGHLTLDPATYETA